MAENKRTLLHRARAGLDLALNINFSLLKIQNQPHRFPGRTKVVNQLNLPSQTEVQRHLTGHGLL
jgi:hypothetical protein